MTTPDGKLTATCYDPWVTVVINPKSQKKRQVADAYGRTVTIQEYTGSYDPGQCSASVGSPYATTSYAYDGHVWGQVLQSDRLRGRLPPHGPSAPA